MNILPKVKGEYKLAFRQKIKYSQLARYIFRNHKITHGLKSQYESGGYTLQSHLLTLVSTRSEK